jgi:hypothetical protein
MSSAIPFRKTELFGGAMSCLMPASFEDISGYRTVPDHQEVFVDKESNTSVTIEILARAEDVPTATGVQTDKDGEACVVSGCVCVISVMSALPDFN